MEPTSGNWTNNNSKEHLILGRRLDQAVVADFRKQPNNFLSF